MGYGVWRVEIEGLEGWLVKLNNISLEIYDIRDLGLMTVEMLVYLSHVLHLCSSLLDGSICSEYDVRYFCGHSYLFTLC